MNSIRFEHIPEVGITKTERLSIAQVSELLDEPGREMAFKALAETELSLQIDRKGDNATITGRGVFSLSHPCVRCLEEIVVGLELDMNLELEKPDVIDLTEVLREEMFLELPHYPACEPVCISL
ncbi:MAG: hypothetical protein V4534_09000 [Myxococcota bacterium]